MVQALSPVRKSVLVLRAAYPRAVINPETVEVYLASLSDIDGNDLEKAVASVIRESKYFPTIAEILTEVAEQKFALPTPTEAWVEAASRASGTWGERDRHPLVGDAIRAMGGTYSIKTAENQTIMRHQFFQVYDELRSRVIKGYVRDAFVPPALEASSVGINEGNERGF